MKNSVFLAACRRESTPHTPIWLMRQAGRYMQEYRDVRARYSFLELCKNPEVAAEVTVTAVQKLGVDAAIIFADILLVLEPLGAGLEFTKNDGPVLHNPVRTPEDLQRLLPGDSSEAVPFVYDAVRLAKAALEVPLIGFSGAPFTLASYLIEGGGSRNYIHTKKLMYGAPQAWNALMGRLSCIVAGYLNRQIAAGADAVQIFDSWVGCLSPADYREYVLPHMRGLIAAITPGTPVIHFGTDTGGLLEPMREAGGNVIGLDWRIELDVGWHRLGPEVGVQGNLDPVTLFAPLPEIRRRTQAILQAASNRPGHIFNLGHGILPHTPVHHVQALVEMVHELSDRRG